VLCDSCWWVWIREEGNARTTETAAAGSRGNAIASWAPWALCSSHRQLSATNALVYSVHARKTPLLTRSHSPLIRYNIVSSREGARHLSLHPTIITTTQRTSIAAAVSPQHTMLGRHLQRTPQQQVRCARRAAPFQRPRMTAAKAANGTTQRKHASPARSRPLGHPGALQFLAAAAQSVLVCASF
jgi:hypothetical protein